MVFLIAVAVPALDADLFNLMLAWGEQGNITSLAAESSYERSTA